MDSRKLAKGLAGSNATWRDAEDYRRDFADAAARHGAARAGNDLACARRCSMHRAYRNHAETWV